MEREPPADIIVSPTVRDKEEWKEVLADDDLRTRFNELVDLTQSTLDVAEYPWVAERHDVASRWQHLINMLGVTAKSHGHPLFAHGGGWSDQERVQEVLEPVDYRSFDAGFVENALILTHSLAVHQGQSDNPGLSVSLNTLNNKRDNQDGELAERFTSIFDLRDMAEPTETLIGDMSLDDFKRLSEAEIEELDKKLMDLVFEAPNYGKRYGWENPPQKERYLDERYRLIEYGKLAVYGTVDGKEIDNIHDEQKAGEIAKLRQERPDFGKLPDDFKDLPDGLKVVVETLFWYFDNHRARYDYISIDTYSFFANLDLQEADLKALEKAGILILNGDEPMPSPAGPLWDYKLSAPYYEHWVSRHYTEEQS
jgi:hypothetical protein